VISCQEACLLIEQQLHQPLPWTQRMGLRFHLLICKACKAFSHQATSIRAIFRDDQNLPSSSLSPEARQRLSDRLREQSKSCSD
jgi:hypothetical protein